MHFKTLSLLFLSTTALAAWEDLIPTGVQEFVTLAPSEVQSSLSEDPKYGLSVLSSIHYSNAPEWFSELPEQAQNAISSAADSMTASYPEPTGESGGDGGDSDGDDGDSDGDSDGGDGGSNEGGDDPDDNAAARPSGAVFASLAGAAGVLGLAIAL